MKLQRNMAAVASEIKLVFEVMLDAKQGTYLEISITA